LNSCNNIEKVSLFVCAKILSLEIIGAASVSIAGIVVFDHMLSIMDGGGGGGARSRRKARMLQFATLVFAVFLVFLGEFVVGQSSTYMRPPLAPAKSDAVEKLLQERKNLTASTDPDQVREFRLQDVNCNRFLAGSASSTCFLACLLRGLDLHC
jgi:hypothetical protein